jgi:exosortase
MSRATVGDLGLALLIGAAVGAGPHTSAHRLIPSVLGGVLAAALTLVLRIRARRSRLPRAALLEPPSLLLVLLLFGAALVFAPTVVDLFPIYTDSIWRNGHGLFVPLVMGARAWATLRREPSTGEESSPWGLAPLALGLGLAVVDSAVHTVYLGTLGIIVFLVGLSLLLLGARRTRALALPLALGLLLLPLSTSLAQALHLPEATAAGVELALEAFGTPVERDQRVLWMPQFVYGVSDNCSGFSSFYAGLGAAVVLGYYGGSRLRAALLLLAVWPLAWLTNVARLLVVIEICERHGIALLHTPIHGLSGIVAFWAVPAGLWLLADRRAIREALT